MINSGNQTRRPLPVELVGTVNAEKLTLWPGKIAGPGQLLITAIDNRDRTATLELSERWPGSREFETWLDLFPRGRVAAIASAYYVHPGRYLDLVIVAEIQTA